MRSPLLIRAILFDMDDVLVDTSRSYRRAIEETAAHFTGRNIEGGTVQRYKNLGGFNDDWKLTHAIITDAGMEVPFSRIVDEFQRRYRGDEWNGFIAEEPPLVQLRTLETLRKGRALGIVTGRPDAEARWTVDRFGWKPYFPLVVGKEKQEGRGKPDPFPIQRALGMFGAAGLRVRPEEAVYVGDSVDDVAAARAAGVWSIGFVPAYYDRDEHEALLRARGAHVIIHDLDTLPELVDHLHEHLPVEAAEEPQDVVRMVNM